MFTHTQLQQCFTGLTFLVVSLSLSLAHATTAVGVLGAEFRVNESGAATYHVPIVAPVARGEVAPPVSIHYNSQQTRTGLLGVGWQLSAGGAVTRCASNPADDNRISPIYFNNNDHFCLNGQRLHPIEDDKGRDGTQYRLAIDDFSIIKSHGSTNQTIHSPAYFSVETKSGETHYYGNPSAAHYLFDGEDALLPISGDPNIGKVWLLKSIVDSVGNTIEYHYDNRISDGNAYLTAITYGGHVDGDAAYARIDIDYRTLDNAVTGFYFGQPLRNDRFITRITSRLDGVIYRQYNLGYNQGRVLRAHERLMLDAITECAPTAYNNTALSCKPATSFSWLPAQTASSFAPFSRSSRFVRDVNPTHYRLFDINRDGKDDMVYAQGSYWYMANSLTSSHLRLTDNGINSGEVEHAMVMDADADGHR